MTRIPRRSALKATGTAVGAALLATSSLSAVAQSGGDETEDGGSDTTQNWPTFRGDSVRTGFTDVDDVGPAATTQFYVGQSSNPSDPPELTVGDGLVFTSEILDDVTGRCRIVAYDAESGEEQWTHEPPSRGGETPDSGVGGVADPPVLGDGTLYVASSGNNNNGEWSYGGLFAFDTQTGDIQWVNGDSHNYRDATLSNGTLVLQDLPNNRVVAIDAESGDQLWAVARDLITSYLLAVDEDTVYARLVGPGSQYVAGLSLDDGTEMWRHELPADVIADSRTNETPDAIVGEDTIYYATQTADENALVAQSLEDGSVRWNCTLTRDCGDPRETLSKPVLADGSVYAFTSVDPSVDAAVPASVWSVDIEDGTRQWVWSSPYHLYGSPTATDGQVYVGTEAPLTEEASGRYYDVAPISEYPTVVAVDAEEGDVSWAYAEPPENGGEDEYYALTPVPTDRGVYVKVTGDDRDSGTKILALEATDAAIGPNHRPQKL